MLLHCRKFVYPISFELLFTLPPAFPLAQFPLTLHLLLQSNYPSIHPPAFLSSCVDFAWQLRFRQVYVNHCHQFFWHGVVNTHWIFCKSRRCDRWNTWQSLFLIFSFVFLFMSFWFSLLYCRSSLTRSRTSPRPLSLLQQHTHHLTVHLVWQRILPAVLVSAIHECGGWGSRLSSTGYGAHFQWVLAKKIKKYK